jgi:predicted CoA-binding protein
MKPTQVEIHDFLSQRSLAVVGVSRNTKKFGNAIYRTLKQQGYKVFPIHREADSIEGDRCYRGFNALPEKVGGVVLCVPPVQTERILEEILGAGINRVWMQRGAESYAALRFCEKNGISVVHGHCILMFAEPVESIHKFHRWVTKLIGKYPAAGAKQSHPTP